jgi:hypothetical protein
MNRFTRFLRVDFDYGFPMNVILSKRVWRIIIMIIISSPRIISMIISSLNDPESANYCCWRSKNVRVSPAHTHADFAGIGIYYACAELHFRQV